jgi:predicted membrane protein
METRQGTFFAPRLILGLGIITIGALFLLGNLDIINAHDYVRLWPVILVIVGIAYLTQSQNGSGRVWGAILTFVGAAMLLDRLYFIHFDLWDYWPLILVFIGATMILRGTPLRKAIVPPGSDSNDAHSYIKGTAILGGLKRNNNSQDFKGGELTAFMGGLEIDLRDASIKGEAVIDIFAMMGGVDMRIPDDWTVIMEGFPILGGFEDKTHPPKQSTKRLVIKGTVIMGGVDIKN